MCVGACKVHTADDGSIMEVPIILPSSWLKLLLTDYPFLLSGSRGQDLHQELDAFWTCFKHTQGGHVVFNKSAAQLCCTLPLLLHGDEGRYLKRGQFMVCTVESMIGNDPDKRDKKNRKKACSCCSDPVLHRYGDLGLGNCEDPNFLKVKNTIEGQEVNDSGNEFLSKFLLFGMSTLVYKKHRALLDLAFQKVADDMNMLQEVGVVCNGQTYFAATLGCKGDLKFHKQTGYLTRSYYNVGQKNNIPMCSLCLAGCEGVRFETLSDRPNWMETMYKEKPWDENDPPPLTKIAFEPGHEEGIYRLDLFHCWKMGLGRDLTGSTLIVLSELKYFDFSPDDTVNIKDRLQRAHSCFVLWARANNKSPALHSFSTSLLNYPNKAAFAWFNVKGCDNTLLTHWLLFSVRLFKQTHGTQFPVLQAAMEETLASATAFFDLLHSHSLWLNRVCAQRAQHHLTVMLRGYMVLAREAKSLSLVAYGIKPKLHALDHINKDLMSQLQRRVPKVLNPMAYSCEANESVVGHVSRISRKVNSRTVSCRVLDRICIRMKSVIKKLKSKLRHGRK